MTNIVNDFDFDTLPVSLTYCGKIDDKEWPHFLWNVVIAYQGGAWSFPYKCGIGHIEKKPFAGPDPKPTYRKGTTAYEQWINEAFHPKKPKISDIIYSILMESEAASMSFNEWCGDFGYDTDSMKAFKTYQACCEEGEMLRKAFTNDQIQVMKIALDGY